MCRPGEILPGRRVSRRGKGCGADGRARSDHQWQLCRVHARRASNVALIESGLPWAELAAIPETYATAWTCLFRNLEIKKGELLLIRGATSSFGQAALKMAVNAGVRVVATTRNRERFSMLEKS